MGKKEKKGGGMGANEDHSGPDFETLWAPTRHGPFFLFCTDEVYFTREKSTRKNTLLLAGRVAYFV